MARLLPGKETSTDAEPRVVGLDDEDAEELLAAMSSDTARELLAALHGEPATASELADRAGTSLQNAQYHLGRLADAGAVEVADSAYSEKGREMKVYAPADDPLVVVAGDEGRTGDLRSLVTRLFGAVAALAGGALLVQWLVEVPERGGMAAMDAGGGGAGGAAGGFLAEPGVLFFAGGLVVLALAVAARVIGR